MTEPPPDPPELPEAAWPRWPAWNAPVALCAGLGAVVIAAFPIVPIALLSDAGKGVGGVATLILLLVQDAMLVGAALVFALITLKPRPWHFGVRSTRFWPTAGLAALAALLLFGIETGYIELLHVNETNVDDLSDQGLVAAIAVGLAVIVVAPVSEEIFFRAFFYRALRTRLRVWSAALIDGIVFGSLHFSGPDTAVILPVIAVFGTVQCLVYERTGSLFAVIAIHAAFNTVASLGAFPLVAIVIGLGMLVGCAVVGRRVGPAPSPFARDPRARA